MTIALNTVIEFFIYRSTFSQVHDIWEVRDSLLGIHLSLQYPTQ